MNRFHLNTVFLPKGWTREVIVSAGSISVSATTAAISTTPATPSRAIVQSAGSAYRLYGVTYAGGIPHATTAIRAAAAASWL